MCTLGLRLIVINVQCSTFFSNSEVFIRLYTLRVFAANNQFLSKHTRQPNSCFSENKQNCFELPTICVNPASWSHQSLWETARGKTHNLTLGVTKHCSPAQPVYRLLGLALFSMWGKRREKNKAACGTNWTPENPKPICIWQKQTMPWVLILRFVKVAADGSVLEKEGAKFWGACSLAKLRWRSGGDGSVVSKQWAACVCSSAIIKKTWLILPCL